MFHPAFAKWNPWTWAVINMLGILALCLPVVSHSVSVAEWIRYGPQYLLETLPFNGATTKESLLPKVPQALYNKGPSIGPVSTLHSRATTSCSTHSVWTITLFLLEVGLNVFVLLEASFFTYLFYFWGKLALTLSFVFSMLSLLGPAVHIDMRLEDEVLSS